MTKSELIQKMLEKYPNHTSETMAKIVDIIFGDIAKALLRGNRAEIRRFGSFSVRTRSAKTTINPRTGEDMKISERNIVYFRPGKEFKEILNN